MGKGENTALPDGHEPISNRPMHRVRPVQALNLKRCVLLDVFSDVRVRAHDRCSEFADRGFRHSQTMHSPVFTIAFSGDSCRGLEPVALVSVRAFEPANECRHIHDGHQASDRRDHRSVTWLPGGANKQHLERRLLTKIV